MVFNLSTSLEKNDIDIDCLCHIPYSSLIYPKSLIIQCSQAPYRWPYTCMENVSKSNVVH